MPLVLLLLSILLAPDAFAAAPGCFVERLSNLSLRVENAGLTPMTRFERVGLFPEKVMDPTRLAKAVKVTELGDVGRSTALADLADGTYVYVFDSRGRFAIMDRVMDHPDGVPFNEVRTFVGSHEGLLAHLNSRGGEATEILAAGEIVHRDGSVAIVSNGSGTWRGGQTQLLYAESKLRGLGLPIHPGTRVLDYSTGAIPNPHMSVSDQVRMELKFRQDPQLRAIFQDTRETMRAASEDRTLKRKLMNLSLDDNVSRETAEHASYGVQFMSSWRSAIDGEAYIIQLFLNEMGEKQFKQMLSFMRKQSKGM